MEIQHTGTILEFGTYEGANRSVPYSSLDNDVPGDHMESKVQLLCDGADFIMPLYVFADGNPQVLGSIYCR